MEPQRFCGDVYNGVLEDLAKRQARRLGNLIYFDFFLRGRYFFSSEESPKNFIPSAKTSKAVISLRASDTRKCVLCSIESRRKREPKIVNAIMMGFVSILMKAPKPVPNTPLKSIKKTGKKLNDMATETPVAIAAMPKFSPTRTPVTIVEVDNSPDLKRRSVLPAA